MPKTAFRPTGKPIRSVMLCVPDPLNAGVSAKPKYLFVVSRPHDQDDNDMSVTFAIVDRSNKLVETSTAPTLGRAMDYCDAFAQRHRLELHNFTP